MCLTAVLGSCDSAGGVDSEPTATTQTSSPATTSPDDPQSIALAEVSDLVVSYYDLSDDLAADPALSVEQLTTVTVDPLLTADSELYDGVRSQGLKGTGSYVVKSIEATKWDLAANPPTVGVSACIDASGTDVIDATGSSVADPNQPDYWIASLTVIQSQPGDDSSWRVSDKTDTPVDSCDS